MNKLKLNFLYAFVSFFIFTVFSFSSCMSIQKDIYVEEDEIADGGFSQEMESRVAQIDAEFYLGKTLDETLAARNYVLSQIDSRLSVTQIDKNQEARLQALKGRVLVLGGKTSPAKKSYDRARSLNSAEVQVIILGRRLGILENLTDFVASKESSGVLVLEAALEQFENAHYAESVGLFDRAFLTAAPFYRSSYQAVRDKAWNFKDFDFTNNSGDLLLKNTLTFTEFLEITQNSSAILDFYIGGRKLSGQKLFNAVKNAGLLEPKSLCEFSGEQAPVTSDAVVTRTFFARFLWNVYTQNKDDSYAVRYSVKARSKAEPKSPVPDLDVWSVDYDAVLGCVENEIILLEDGKNFCGEEPVSVYNLMYSLSVME